MDVNNIHNSIQAKTVSSGSSVRGDAATVVSSAEKQSVSNDVTKATLSSSSVDAIPDGVDKVLSQLNEQLESSKSYLKFEKDESSEKLVFFIKNSETGETIRQVPTKELLDISKNITEYLDMVSKPGVSGAPSLPAGLITNQVV